MDVYPPQKEVLPNTSDAPLRFLARPGFHSLNPEPLRFDG